MTQACSSMHILRFWGNNSREQKNTTITLAKLAETSLLSDMRRCDQISTVHRSPSSNHICRDWHLSHCVTMRCVTVHLVKVCSMIVKLSNKSNVAMLNCCSRITRTDGHLAMVMEKFRPSVASLCLVLSSDHNEQESATLYRSV